MEPAANVDADVANIEDMVRELAWMVNMHSSHPVTEHFVGGGPDKPVPVALSDSAPTCGTDGAVRLGNPVVVTRLDAMQLLGRRTLPDR